MSDAALDVVLWIGGLGLAIMSGMAGVIITLVLRNADRRERSIDERDHELGRAKDRLGDKQAGQGENLASVVTRVGTLEAAFVQLADALQRIARLEEWRSNSSRRLDDADTTSRAVVSLQEQNRTIFKRMDATDDKLDELVREQADTPRRTAELLRTMIRPVSQPQRAANG